MIHRQTLAELYLILKEEADVFEECIEKTEHKRYYTNSQKFHFIMYSLDPRKEEGQTIVICTEKLSLSSLRL